MSHVATIQFFPELSCLATHSFSGENHKNVSRTCCSVYFQWNSSTQYHKHLEFVHAVTFFHIVYLYEAWSDGSCLVSAPYCYLLQTPLLHHGEIHERGACSDTLIFWPVTVGNDFSFIYMKNARFSKQCV